MEELDVEVENEVKMGGRGRGEMLFDCTSCGFSEGSGFACCISSLIVNETVTNISHKVKSTWS